MQLMDIKKTGATIALDGTEDDLVVREAGVFFREQNMRPKINKTVLDVQVEAKAGRLCWTREEVEGLIRPYPNHKEVDLILARQEDYTRLEEGEMPYQEENGDDASAVAEIDHSGDEELSGSEELLDDDHAVADLVAISSVAAPMLEAEPAVAETMHMAVLSAAEAENLEKSQTLIEAYTQSLVALRACGAMSAAVHLENEIRKEKRRQRFLSRENANVAQAMARRRDVEIAANLKQRRLAADANAISQAATKSKNELAVAGALMRKRKADLVEIEGLKESKYTMKRFSLENLGEGHPKGGGAVAKKRRFEVLDRLMRLGSGLSVAQKNDWVWFKDAWDEKMVVEHKGTWGGLFATWMQQVLDDYEQGIGNSISLFVHRETRRCFDLVPALLIPGAAVAEQQ
jgi:hypothetical protein